MLKSMYKHGIKKALSLLLSLVVVICSFSAFVTTAYAAPTGLKVINCSPYSITVEWNPAYMNGGCDGYEIYSCNSKGKYTKLAGVNSSVNRLRLKDLKSDSAYKLAIRSYCKSETGRSFSDYSEPVYCRTSPTDNIMLKSVSYTAKGKMTVKWNRVSDASGYIIKYSTSPSFSEKGATCTKVVDDNSKTSLTLSGLSRKKYYVRICTYKSYKGNKFSGLYSDTQSVSIKSDDTLKSKLNAMKSTTKNRKYIKEYTNGGVDISKYSTTYDRVKAIYNWHSKNNKYNDWDCVGCNSNFNQCLYFLFEGTDKKYDIYIRLAAGNFKNNDGSLSMHKWSVLYIAGTPYIFDPRLQGYTSDKAGSTYFGISKSDAMSKKFLFDFWFLTWMANNNEYSANGYIISPESRPKTVNIKNASSKTAGKIKLDWDKVACSGYQIQYSRNSDFSKCKYTDVDNSETVSKTIVSLNSGKKYYVRIRAYKTIGSNRIYGFYSTTKIIKTK